MSKSFLCWLKSVKNVTSDGHNSSFTTRSSLRSKVSALALTVYRIFRPYPFLMSKQPSLSMLKFHQSLSKSLYFMESVPNSLQIIFLLHEVLRAIRRMEGGACVMVTLTLGRDMAEIFGRQLEHVLILLSANWTW